MEKSDLERELERVTTELHYRYQQRGSNERFSVTVWSALVIAVVTRKASLDSLEKFLILLLPVFLFWFAAMLQNMLIVRRQRLIQKIERTLASGDISTEDPEEYFFNLVDSKMAFSEKLQDLFTAIRRELAHSLYVLQAGLSVLAVWVTQ